MIISGVAYLCPQTVELVTHTRSCTRTPVRQAALKPSISGTSVMSIPVKSTDFGGSLPIFLPLPANLPIYHNLPISTDFFADLPNFNF